MNDGHNGQCLNPKCGARISKNKVYCKQCLNGENKNV